ncbi:Tet(A)/Tet(B)/Tet(C) family tetracycline efflux MFS transporter [Achromobacter sp.]|uniref:Tet(A)/Tet(B)/Tet(C) family tetracycline efflux MFS transporter n=1 Tax=Achromobacter sp. TaxID=134375 RepID=UPI002F95182D
MRAGHAFVILGTVALDAVGIGLVMPVLPGLLRGLVHSEDIAGHYGALLAAYALMQFLCAPALGALSDRYGRRPILLLSLAGAAIDYLIMATAPTLLVLYLGRLVAGITGATGAVAGACIADVTKEGERARYFGLMSACFGVGMIAGPVIGGLLGGISPQLPFLAAAILNGLNFLMACFLLPESHRGERRPLSLKALMPAASFLWARGKTAVIALMAVFFLMQFVGQVPATLWVIYGEDRYQWDAATVGLSLAAFGALHALVQALATGPATARLGEKRTLLLGMAADALGYVLLAFATRGWMAFPIMVLLASGGIGMPALQAMLSAQVEQERQGQLQGALAALSSLSAIVGPLAITALYAATLNVWKGWAWIAGAGLYFACLPALRRGTSTGDAWYGCTGTTLLSRNRNRQGKG